jgi:thiol-disulfide isomerase/thioredoxin
MRLFRERFGAAVGFSFILAVTAACGGGKPDAKSPGSEGGSPQGGTASVGNPAPDLSIQTINGKGKISIESLKGKVAIIDFWATWCGPCKQSFPKYEELAKKHAGQLEIVGVSVDDEQNGVAQFAKETGATFAIGWDEGHSIANRWDVKSMPTAYILDATGTIRYVHAGFHDDEPEQIAKELTALLDESKGKTAVASAKEPSSSSSSSSSSSASTTSASSGSSGEESGSGSSEQAEAPPAPPPKKAGAGKGKGGGKKSGGKPKKKR